MSKTESKRYPDHGIGNPHDSVESLDDEQPAPPVISLTDEANMCWLDEPGPSRTPLSQVSDPEEIEQRRANAQKKLAALRDED